MPSHAPAVILAALREVGIDAQPHELGLALYCRDPHEYARALKRCIPDPPTRLRVLTMGEGDNVGLAPCDGTMTCQCQRCVGDRVARKPLGSGPAAFKVRHARRAA